MGVEAMDDGWQPIETAPSGGTVIIGGWNFDGGPDPKDQWIWVTAVAWREDGIWAVDVCECYEVVTGTIDVVVAWRPEMGPPDWAVMPPSPRCA